MSSGNVGDTVELIQFAYDPQFHSCDDNLQVPAGTQGVINRIDSSGIRFVSWANGSSLGLLPDRDQYRIVALIKENPYI
jgi:hypothetical protein